MFQTLKTNIDDKKIFLIGIFSEINPEIVLISDLIPTVLKLKYILDLDPSPLENRHEETVMHSLRK